MGKMTGDASYAPFVLTSGYHPQTYPQKLCAPAAGRRHGTSFNRRVVFFDRVLRELDGVGFIGDGSVSEA
jgi:hypothetical protein